MNDQNAPIQDELTEEILNGIRGWIEIESPTDIPEAMARMSARIQADYEAIGLRVERIAGRKGMGDHLLITADQLCPPEVANGSGILVLSPFCSFGSLDGCFVSYGKCGSPCNKSNKLINYSIYTIK